MIHSDRVLERMAAAGLSQSELARRVHVTQGAIAKIVSKNPGGSSHLHKIAQELGTTPAYLTGETDDPSAGAVPTPTPQSIADHLDMVQIQEIDLAFGMGGTYSDGMVETKARYFPRAWIEAITSTAPALLTFARGKGDSMMPTLLDGDMVLIDRSQRTIREQDALWAITIGDIAMIKRIRVRGPNVSILSDNDNVPTDEAQHDEINVVGRVVFIGRRL
ncbi:MAG: S24 family peptidase [Sphingomonas sp.]|uniref:S24 family peptidase n=1 Tax=Sphingomonas sp. TaxID=28214 RepID=UPI0035620D01